MPDTRKQIEELINSASKDAQAVVGEIFKIEKDKLYMSTPYGIVEEIVDHIKDIVK